MLGPEANNYVTVTHPHNFHWREGSFGDLIPLLGDGLLTIDGGYHDRARRIMMPAFHREQIEAAVDDDDRARRRRRSTAMRPGRGRRRLRLDAQPGDADRDAGAARPRPRRRRPRAAAAEHFERALGFYGTEYHLRLLRGPRSPWRRMMSSRKVLDRIVAEEIARRRADSRPRSPRRAQPADRRPRRGRQRALRRGDPRPADDADVRRPRHLDLDRLVPLLRARPPPRGARAAAGRAGRGARRRAADARPSSPASCRTSTWSSTRSCASTRRPGSARAARCATSSSPAAPSRPAPTSTTSRGPATGCPRSSPTPRRSSPSASRRERKTALPARRLRAVRRRLADLHRQALRPDRGQAGRDDGAAAAALRAAARPDDDDPPDADALARRRPAMRVLSSP